MQKLGDICSSVILDNVHLLEKEGEHTEKSIQLLASKHLNTSILTILDHKNWIKSLNLKASNLTDEGLARISVLQGLTSLNIAECAHVSDNGVTKLKAHQSLCSLDLSKTKVSDDGVRGLASCPNLEVLDLSYTQVGDAALLNFGGHVRLQSLLLRNTRVSNELFLHWNSTGTYPVALHTLIMPFTRVGDESAKAIAEVPSLALIDLKSTKYSQSGLITLQAGLRRHKGVTVKLLPGNKLEVPSAARPATVCASNTFVWLTDAISSFALMQGAYAQTQKRNCSPATTFTRQYSMSMFGSFSNLNLSSSVDSDTPSNQSNTEKYTVPEERSQPPTITAPLPIAKPSPQLASAQQPVNIPNDTKLSVYDDFSSDEEPAESAPKQTAKLQPKTAPAMSTIKPTTPDSRKQILAPKQRTSRAARKEKSSTSIRPLVPKDTSKILPKVAPKVATKVSTNVHPTDNKENEPLNTSTGKRKSPRLESKSMKTRKIEKVNDPIPVVPQVKTKRKATTPKSTSKRTKLHHAPVPVPPTYTSPYHTRSSLTTTPLESLPNKKQKKKSPSVPTPLSLSQPLFKDLDMSTSSLNTSSSLDSPSRSTDPFIVSYILDDLNLHTQPPAIFDSSMNISESTNDNNTSNNTSENNNASSLANCDLSIISSLADVKLQSSTELLTTPPTNTDSTTPMTDISMLTTLPTSSHPTHHGPTLSTTDTSMSTTPPPEPTLPASSISQNDHSLSDISFVPGTPSFCPSPSSPAPPTPLIDPTDVSMVPATPFCSPPSTPTKQVHTEPQAYQIPVFATAPRTPPPTPLNGPRTPPTKSTRPSTVPKPRPITKFFHPLSPPSQRPSINPRTTPPTSRPLTPTTPPTSRNPRTPTTPTTPTNRPTKPLTSAERERNQQLNNEFLRMRRLLLY